MDDADSQLKQIYEAINEQRLEVKKLAEEFRSYREHNDGAISDLRSSIYELKMRLADQEFLFPREPVRRERYTLNSLFLGAFPSLGNSTTDPEHVTFLPEEYPKL